MKQELEQRLLDITKQITSIAERDTQVLNRLPETVFPESRNQMLHEMAQFYVDGVTPHTDPDCSASNKASLQSFLQEHDLPVKEVDAKWGQGIDKLRNLTDVLATYSVEERLIGYEMARGLIGFAGGCDCYSCDSSRKKPIVMMFGIQEYQGDDYGRSPNSFPKESTISKVMLETCYRAAGMTRLDEKVLKAQKENVEALITLEQRGIDTDKLAQKQPKLYETISTVPNVFVFNEESGIVVTITDHSWYQPLSSPAYKHGIGGGVGKSRIVTVVNPNGSSKEYKYQWRDQYNPNKDNDSNFLRNIQSLSVKDNVLTIEFESATGVRRIDYNI